MKTLYDNGKVHEEYIADSTGVIVEKITYGERHGLPIHRQFYKDGKECRNIKYGYNDNRELSGSNAYKESSGDHVLLACDYVDGKMGSRSPKHTMWTWCEVNGDIVTKCIFGADHVITKYWTETRTGNKIDEYNFINGEITLTATQASDPKNHFTLTIDEESCKVIKTMREVTDPKKNKEKDDILVLLRSIVCKLVNTEYKSDTIAVKVDGKKVTMELKE